MGLFAPLLVLVSKGLFNLFLAINLTKLMKYITQIRILNLEQAYNRCNLVSTILGFGVLRGILYTTCIQIRFIQLLSKYASGSASRQILA